MKSIRSCILSVSSLVLTSKEKFLLEKANPLGVTLFKRNIQNKDQLSLLIKEIKETIGREDVLVAIDQEGGRVCRLTSPEYRSYAAQAQMGKMKSVVRQKAIRLHTDLISDDLHKLGFNVNYTPVMDTLFPKTTLALGNRCFSENEKIVACCGKEMILEYIKRGICPCIKHLPGHGKATTDPHLNLPIIETKLADLEQDFYPFKQVASLAPLGMTAHIILKGFDSQPATHSKKIINQIIRQQIGFNGFLISDAIEMGALSGTMAERTEKCLSAGCDAVCYCGGILDGNEEVVKSSRSLSDASMCRFQKIHDIICGSCISQKNILKKEKEYKKLISQLDISKTDYDVVETLNQRKSI